MKCSLRAGACGQHDRDYAVACQRRFFCAHNLLRQPHSCPCCVVFRARGQQRACCKRSARRRAYAVAVSLPWQRASLPVHFGSAFGSDCHVYNVKWGGVRRFAVAQGCSEQHSYSERARMPVATGWRRPCRRAHRRRKEEVRHSAASNGRSHARPEKHERTAHGH